MKQRTPRKQIFCLFSTHGLGQKVNKIWRRSCYISDTMQVKCWTVCTHLTFWIVQKGQTLKFKDKYILIELSNLICFGYDLPDLCPLPYLYFVVNTVSSCQVFRWATQVQRSSCLSSAELKALSDLLWSVSVRCESLEIFSLNISWSIGQNFK